MYTEFFKKNSSNILKYLQKLGKKKKIYSKRCEGEIPMLESQEMPSWKAPKTSQSGIA